MNLNEETRENLNSTPLKWRWSPEDKKRSKTVLWLQLSSHAHLTMVNHISVRWLCQGSGQNIMFYPFTCKSAYVKSKTSPRCLCMSCTVWECVHRACLKPDCLLRLCYWISILWLSQYYAVRLRMTWSKLKHPVLKYSTWLSLELESIRHSWITLICLPLDSRIVLCVIFDCCFWWNSWLVLLLMLVDWISESDPQLLIWI